MHVSRSLSNNEQAAGSIPTIPEKELLLAILDRSVLDFHSKNRRLSKAAAEWLFEDEECSESLAFSFGWICQFLSIEKESLRSSIRSLDLSSKPPQGHRWLRRKVKRPSGVPLTAPEVKKAA